MAGVPLSITLLASEWKSSKGGLSTLNRELAIQLAKRPDVSVTFLVPKCSDEDMKNALEYQVKIVKAKELDGFDEDVWLSFPPENLLINFIIGHGVVLGKQAQIIRDSHNCKWLQIVHTAPEELAVYKTYCNAIVEGERKQMDELKLCQKGDLVAAVGPKLMETYSAYLRSCGKEVYNLTPGIFSGLSSLELTSEQRGTCKKFRILVFGRGDPEDFKLKGFDIAAEAVAELNDSSYLLTFIGAPSGSETEVRNNLLQYGLKENQLIVKGYLENREYLTCNLCASNLVIIPSRTEGFGLTALEALSAGLPFLVSQNSGFAEAIQEIGPSFIVHSEDPVDWAKKIKSVRRRGSETATKECRQLRARYAERYRWETQCKDLVAMMRASVYSVDQTSSTRKILKTETVGQQTENDELETGLEARKSYDQQGAKPKERFSSRLFSGEKAEEPGNESTLIALPDKVAESLLLQSCGSKEVVRQLKENLQLDHAALELPGPETKRLIRNLALKAKHSSRLDVVKHLREITPAGTTGPLLPGDLDIRNIPVHKWRELSVDLSGGEEWKVVAERLGLTASEIRYLDARTVNPFDAAMAFMSQKMRITVEDLYDVLMDCGFPVFADTL